MLSRMALTTTCLLKENLGKLQENLGKLQVLVQEKVGEKVLVQEKVGAKVLVGEKVQVQGMVGKKVQKNLRAQQKILVKQNLLMFNKNF